MTLNECLAWAAKASENWYVDNRGFVRTLISSSSQKYCPITAAAKAKRDRNFSLTDWGKAARILRLPHKEAEKLKQAADNESGHKKEVRNLVREALKPICYID